MPRAVLESRQHACGYVRYLDRLSCFPLLTSGTTSAMRSLADRQDLRRADQRQGRRALPPDDDRPWRPRLDPTCGSGTTAYVAEQWGRRWITIDTSRVALALARTRLMAARFPVLPARRLARRASGRKPSSPAKNSRRTSTDGDIRKGFVYKRVPHVTLKSIANNPDIKEGMTRAQIDQAIARHAETETLLRPALRGQEHRPRHRAVHRREPVAAPRARRTDDETTGTEADGRRGVDRRFRDDDPRQPQEGRRPEHGQERAAQVRPLEPFAGDLDPRRRAHRPTPTASRSRRRVDRPRVRHGRPAAVKEAAKEAFKGIGFDILIVCGFAFDPHVAEETRSSTKAMQLGKLPSCPSG